MIENNRLTTEQYQKNFEDIHGSFETLDTAIAEANRCLFCYDAPCIKSCPTRIDIPKFIYQIGTKNLKGSASTILESNILGASCSKVCPVEKLCEGSCVHNLHKVKPIHIAKLQRFATNAAMNNNWQLFTREKSKNKKVAIIGAGPAGLACAHALSREGVDVTIFEKEEKGGGLMTYGIAAYKITHPDFEAELNYILSIGGIEIKYKQELGKDISLTDLKQNFDAVYLAIGIGLARQLNIPGEELEGVRDAIEFIYELRSNNFNQTPIGDKVVVIGMGMTAIDTATQAKRLGAGDVTILYRRTEAESPCTKIEMDLALLDECKIIWLASPIEIKGKQGKVSSIVCDIMTLGEPDNSGRKSPRKTGETFELEADMVIKAAGQVPYFDFVDANKIENKTGKISIHNDQSTNIKGVFAGGDCVNGGKEVVDAVQSGKEGAAAILDYILSSKNRI